MITCPNCHHKELPGAYFCGECGKQLIPLNFLQTHVIQKPFLETASNRELSHDTETRKTVVKIKDPSISLHLTDSGRVIHLSDKKDFTLGRAIEGQSILPDVDLSPFDAFAQGVSRMHCGLRLVNGDVYAMDLGSSNGTRINGKKIVPHVEYSINHGDLLILGKLKMQVLLIR